MDHLILMTLKELMVVVVAVVEQEHILVNQVVLEIHLLFLPLKEILEVEVLHKLIHPLVVEEVQLLQVEINQVAHLQEIHKLELEVQE